MILKPPDKVRSMKCPFCVDGVNGTDCYGEATECEYCDGNGRITSQDVKEHVDARLSQSGDLWVAHTILQEVYQRCKRLNPDLRSQIKSFIHPQTVE